MAEGELPADRIVLLQSVSGIFRVFLRQARPRFELYVTPANIDPKRSRSADLDAAVRYQRRVGRSRSGCPTPSGHGGRHVGLAEKRIEPRRVPAAKRQRTRRRPGGWLRYELAKRFESGLLFFYISSVDQNAGREHAVGAVRRRRVDRDLSRDRQGMVGPKRWR